MYLSRVEIDSGNRRKIKELSHVGAYHNWVEQSFPEEFTRHERSRKLWRVDQLRGKHYLLVISSEKPDLKLLERYGVAGTGEVKSYDHFLDSLKGDEKMRFRVVLNPVISVSQGIGKRGMIKPHITVEHQIKYLMDRAEKNGFSLKEEEFSVVERGYITVRKEKQPSIHLVKAVYEGILTIKDRALFRRTLIDGMGKKKAYGFGMMTVIPMRN